MKHTQTVFAHYHKNYDGTEEFPLFHCDMSKAMPDYIKICDVVVNFETPDDFNPIAAQVEMLNAEKARISKEFKQRVAAINEQISKLLAISYEAKSDAGTFEVNV